MNHEDINNLEECLDENLRQYSREMDRAQRPLIIIAFVYVAIIFVIVVLMTVS